MRTREELDRLIKELNAEERELSWRRRQLHERLAMFPSEFGNRREREISQQRRELHRRLDELVVERHDLSRRQRSTAFPMARRRPDVPPQPQRDRNLSVMRPAERIRTGRPTAPPVRVCSNLRVPRATNT